MGRTIKISRLRLSFTGFLSFFIGGSMAFVTLLSIAQIPLDYQVNPEYLNGLLTVTSILFGFWAAFLVLKTQRKEDAARKNMMRGIILVNLLWFAVTIDMFFFSAFNKIPSLILFWTMTMSLLLNILLLGATINIYL
jgi:hypothetical protein